eukprot:c19354_g1_i2 orf=40-534(-)
MFSLLSSVFESPSGHLLSLEFFSSITSPWLRKPISNQPILFVPISRPYPIALFLQSSHLSAAHLLLILYSILSPFLSPFSPILWLIPTLNRLHSLLIFIPIIAPTSSRNSALKTLTVSSLFSAIHSLSFSASKQPQTSLFGGHPSPTSRYSNSYIKSAPKVLKS